MIYRDTTAIQAFNDGSDTPDAFYDPKHPSELIATCKWKNTDGWRGYYNIMPELGYKSVMDDWVTGDWDDAIAAEHGETPTEAKLKVMEKLHGTIYVIYTPTSNVFSTGYDVLAKDTTSAAPKGTLVAHKTRKFDSDDGSFSVRYHATHVIAYDAPTHTYRLDTGGWNTMTTAKRISEYLPRGYYVYRKNWVMMLHTPDGDVELKDGMEFVYE